jgi:hypothetical protein
MDDFPDCYFLIDKDDDEVIAKYDLFIEKHFPDCYIAEPTFYVFPQFNDEVLSDISEEIEPDGVYLQDIENWIKSKAAINWIRVYQLENNLGI